MFTGDIPSRREICITLSISFAVVWCGVALKVYVKRHSRVFWIKTYGMSGIVRMWTIFIRYQTSVFSLLIALTRFSVLLRPSWLFCTLHDVEMYENITFVLIFRIFLPCFVFSPTSSGRSDFNNQFLAVFYIFRDQTRDHRQTKKFGSYFLHHKLWLFNFWSLQIAWFLLPNNQRQWLRINLTRI